MRRLMLALSIASFIATPAAFAHGHHFGHASASRAHGHGRHTTSSDSRNNAASYGASFDPSDGSRIVADNGRSRHHDRVPDEEEVAQPEQ